MSRYERTDPEGTTLSVHEGHIGEVATVQIKNVRGGFMTAVVPAAERRQVAQAVAGDLYEVVPKAALPRTGMSSGGLSVDRVDLIELCSTIEDELENHTETFMLNQTIRCEGCRAWVTDDGGVPDLERHRLQVAIAMVSDRIADEIEAVFVMVPRVLNAGEANRRGLDTGAAKARRYAAAVRSRG